VLAHEQFAADAPHLEQLLVVRYEDLVADPDGVMATVFGFLELDDPMHGRAVGEGLNTDNFLSDRAMRTGVNEQYFQTWDARRAKLAKRVYLDLAARVYERRAKRFGYSIRHPRRAPSEVVAVAPRAAASLH
jgi:hypothetical protein